MERELTTKALTDPRAAVATDVALLLAIPALPGEWLISGFIYDVATGLVEIVVPRAYTVTPLTANASLLSHGYIREEPYVPQLTVDNKKLNPIMTGKPFV